MFVQLFLLLSLLKIIRGPILVRCFYYSSLEDSETSTNTKKMNKEELQKEREEVKKEISNLQKKKINAFDDEQYDVAGIVIRISHQIR